MDDSPFRAPMRLTDWTFALAQPVTKRAFRAAQAVGEYCHGYDDWDDYRRRFLSIFQTYVEPLEAIGLNIRRATTSSQYAKLLRGFRGVVLFTHCNRSTGRLEFSDGMVTYESVVRMVSGDFRGIVDVSACNPIGFDVLLKGKAPLCGVKITEDELWPRRWLMFNSHLLSNFAIREMSYAEAIVRTSEALSKKSSDTGAPPSSYDLR